MKNLWVYVKKWQNYLSIRTESMQKFIDLGKKEWLTMDELNWAYEYSTCNGHRHYVHLYEVDKNLRELCVDVCQN